MQKPLPTSSIKEVLRHGLTHRMDVQPLHQDEVRFEVDMCIGCDRCMRACPVPLSALVSIADLNRATVSDDVPPHVVRFTDECVMCGSCVPVCPVDNHRDLLMLSLKQRLGIPWDGKVDLNETLSMLPRGWDLPRLLQTLREQPMFRDTQLVADNYLLHFIATSRVRAVAPGTELMHEGEFGREIYFILDGACDLLTNAEDGGELLLASLRHGDFFGEQGMLTGQPRNCTVRVRQPGVVLEVPEQVMLRLIEVIPALEEFFAQFNTARATAEILQRLELFEGVAESDIRSLAEKAQIKRYDRDEQLFSEYGQNGKQVRPAQQYLHFVLDGFVKVARRTNNPQHPERIIAYRQRGDYFAGGMDMLGDQRAVTVTAINRVTVAEISHEQLKDLMKRYPVFKQRMQERLYSYRSAHTAAYSNVFAPFDRAQLQQPEAVNGLSDGEARRGLHALVEDGVVEGTEVLVIDLDKCIHCDECVEACERRHGHSRMNREGMVVGNISVVTACRQCQDPVCMLCSRAGIARRPGGEVYITESCIGCGICAERCPYDNISIIALDEDEPTQGEQQSWQRFSRFFKKGFGKERGKKMLPMAQTAPQPGPLLPGAPHPIEEIRKKIAIKCDLCAGYNNQACIQACPTGAAIRVNPVTFFGSTEEILQRRSK